MNSATPVKFWQREYFSPAYKIAFLNALHLRLQAGESAGQALRSVVSSEPNPAKRRDMAPALTALEQGETVASALGKLGFFDSTVLAILGAGERSGMREAIGAAAAHLSVKRAWFRQHLLVMFVMVNELASAAFAPFVLYTEILPWIRQHITLPSAPEALLKYEADMAIAENLTLALIGLTVFLVAAGLVNFYRISQLSASTRLLIFFADGAMGVGFKLAAAMLKAGVTIESVARDLSTQSPGWSRKFWAGVHEQLQLAVEPAQALIQRGVYPDEASLLATHANAKQLSEIFIVLSGNREYRAKRGRDLLLVGGTLLTVAYIFMTLGIAIWIYLTYDSTLSAGLDALGNGF